MKMWMLKLLAVGGLVCAGCGAAVTVATEEASVEPTASSSDDAEAPTEDADPTPEDPDPTPEDPDPTPEHADPTPEQADPTPADADPPADDTDTVAAEIAGSAGMAALAEDLPDDAIECAIDGLLDNRELARAVILAGDDDLLADLSPELTDQAIDIVLDCTDDETFAALIVAGFEEDGNDLPDGVAPCFAAELDTDEERRALVKAGLADEGDVDAETVALVVDAVASCIPPGAWVELMISEVGEDDELFEQAISTSCLETLFADDDFVEGLLTAAFNGDFDDDNVITPTQEPLIRGLFDCLDFGTVIAAEAAADGIELSTATVDCMSDAFRELGLVESFISGDEPSDDELGAVIFDCLSVDELRELAGG